MEVVYFSRSPAQALEQETAASRLDLDELLRVADVVSIHLPLTEQTRGLIDAAKLDLLRPTAILVNTARGPIVDERALADRLRRGRLFAAGLDVFEHEPAVNPKLLNLKNVALMPHMGSATEEGRQAMGEKVIINIRTFADGHKPPDRVLATEY